MKISEVFKEAKTRLARDHLDDKTNMICMAIEDIQELGYAEKYFAKKVIEKRLGNSFTVGNWLQKEGLLTDDDWLRDENWARDQVQAFRHRWLDSLIVEFQQQEIEVSPH